jgi:aerobic carbon-monoxide dehydrogenase large subunit
VGADLGYHRPMPGSILGASVKRVEDPRFITGQGRYLGNLPFEGAAWAAFVRSPVAHGRVVSIDAADARSAPGVIGVFTAPDLDLRPIAPAVADLDDSAGRPPIALDTVRFVGEIVAVVVAETERQAVDAADLAWVDIDPLPAVASTAAAETEGAPLLFPSLGSNVVVDHRATGPDPLDGAEVVVEGEFHNQRLMAIPLEPNGAVASWDGERLDVWAGSQNVFGPRFHIARCLGIDRALVRVRVPDVGGGFGAKIMTAPEQIVVAALARALGRPVRWQERRTENMLTMTHGRSQRQRIRLGAHRDGTLVGMDVELIQDVGAYIYFGAEISEWTELMAAGPYRVPAISVARRSVLTNTTPIHAYRGAGRPEATAMVERAMDMLAGELGMDPAELRRRNLLRPDEFPHVTATGARYDSGDYHTALDRALELTGYGDVRAEQDARRQAGDRRQLGVGISTYVEVTAPEARKEWGAVEVHPDGTVTARTGVSPHGQGHETSFAQIVSGLLGIPLDRIRLEWGDTDTIARGSGTMGSRSMQLGGTAVLRAGEGVLEKAREIVAHLAEAAKDDVVLFEDGRIGVAGVPDTGRTWAEVATAAADPAMLPDGMDPGLSVENVIAQEGATYPFGAHVTVVEVDTETGDVTLLRHVAVDDCGVIFNRLLVDGQVHGGVAQGVGQALFEQVLYDEGANPLTANLTTYLLPTATTMPSFVVDHTETPTPENPLGAKGIGESGTIGSTPAVQNAVIDALSHLGVRHVDMPLTAWRVWEAIRAAGRTT